MARVRKFSYSEELGGVGDEYGWAMEDDNDKLIRGKRKEEIKRTTIEYQRVRIKGKHIVSKATVYQALDGDGNVVHLFFGDDGRTYEVVQETRGLWQVTDDVTLLYKIQDMLYG